MTQGTPMITLFPGAPPVSGLPVSHPAVGEDASPFANLFAQWADPATGAPIQLNPEIAYTPLPAAAVLPKNAAFPVVQTVKETPETQTQTEPETTMSNSPLWMAMAGAVLTPAPSAPIRLPEAEKTILQTSPTTEIRVVRPLHPGAAPTFLLSGGAADSIPAAAVLPAVNAPAVPSAGSPNPEQIAATKPPEERLLSVKQAESPPGRAEASVPAPVRGAPPPTEKPPPEPRIPQPIPNSSMQAPEVDAVSKTIGEPKAPLSFPIELPEGSTPVAPSLETGAAPSASLSAEAKPAPSIPSDVEAKPVQPMPSPAPAPALTEEPALPQQTPVTSFVSRPEDPAIVSAPISSPASGTAPPEEPLVSVTTGRPEEIHGEQMTAPQATDSPVPSIQASKTPSAPRHEPHSVPKSSPREAGAVYVHEPSAPASIAAVRETTKPSAVTASPAAVTASPAAVTASPAVAVPTIVTETPAAAAPQMAGSQAETPLHPSVPQSGRAAHTTPAEARPTTMTEPERTIETIRATKPAPAPAASAPHRAVTSQASVLPGEVVETPTPVRPVTLRGVSLFPAEAPSKPVAEAPATPVTALKAAASSPAAEVQREAPHPALHAVPMLDRVGREAVLPEKGILTAGKIAVLIPDTTVSEPYTGPAANEANPTPSAAPGSSVTVKPRAEIASTAVIAPDAPGPAMTANKTGTSVPLQTSVEAHPILVSPKSAAPSASVVGGSTNLSPESRPEPRSARTTIPSNTGTTITFTLEQSGETTPDTAKAAAVLSLSKASSDAQPLLQVPPSSFAKQTETATGTGAGQSESDSPSEGERDLPGVREHAAVRTGRAMMPETVKQETVSENRHLSAKTETAATTPSPVTERSNPLINRHEAVLEEEVTVLQTRAETQRTAGETLFRRGMPREGADRSDPMSSPAPVASDPVTADAGGEQKPAAAPGTASAHVSPTAQAERAETPSSVGQQDRVRVVEQVLQKLDTMRLTQGRQEITLHLKPEHLGQLQVTIVTDRENVFARIVAETPQIRQAVESGRDALRDALEQKGLTLQQMDVSSQQGHGGGRQMPFIPDPYASGARPYRMPGLSTAEETEASHQAVITQSRLTGRLDYVA